MAGFKDNDGSLNLFNIVLKKLSLNGMKYDDMVIKQSKAVGPAEATYHTYSSDESFLYTLAQQDIGTKKYIAYYDKDYPSKREYLQSFGRNSEIRNVLDILTNESIVFDEQNFFANVDISYLNVSDDLKLHILNRYKEIYTAQRFNTSMIASHFFRQFLLEGFLCQEIIYSKDNKRIIGFKELDPISLRPVVIEDESGSLITVWYQYENIPSLFRVLQDSQVIYISFSKTTNRIQEVSYAERLIRSFNLLRLTENSRVMWTVMNSVFRMKMVVPQGNKSPQKIKESISEMLSVYKEDISIDNNSGELSVNGKPGQQFYKNYIFPSNQNGEVQLDSIQYQGPDMTNDGLIQYFKNKLKDDSGVPYSRFDKEAGGNIVLSADGIEREEIRFNKIINSLRSVFQEILIKPLLLQLYIDKPELKDDNSIRTYIGLRFNKDNAFEESKQQTIIKNRIEYYNTLKELKDDKEENLFPALYLALKCNIVTLDELEVIKKYKKENGLDKKEEESAEGDEGGEGGEGDDKKDEDGLKSPF